MKENDLLGKVITVCSVLVFVALFLTGFIW